jgi:RND family efflux transporter MFP subunit
MTSVKTYFQAVIVTVAATIPGWSQPAELAAVIAKPVSRTIDLPGELQPFQVVTLHARVPGYVERVLVDRGSAVSRGQLLAEISAPEMKAQIAEARYKVEAAEADRLQAEAQLAAVQSTADRLKKAAQTEGAVAGNELVLAAKQVDSARAVLESRLQAKHAAEEALAATQELETYLKIVAPFEGVVSERFAHPGVLVGPNSGAPLLHLQQISHLRLVVPVPEEVAGAVQLRATVTFRVPAFAERTYSGVVSRSSHTLDEKTRTMPVELDVLNRDGSLSPGMYATVKWPVLAKGDMLFVPKTSVVTTTERTFVIRARDGRAEWIDVVRGAPEGDLIQVRGALKVGDRVIRRATDEVREGSAVSEKHK